jgi:D-alanyl-D-alanine carboxypeptidase/D-alanyl-D-alanine-endopeptidase (penicillin-binding protein 4)
MAVNSIWAILTVCCLAGAGAAAPAGPVDVAAPAPAREPGPELQEHVAALAAALEQAGGGQAGVSAVDLKTGRTLIAVRDQVPCMPASNQKVLTSAFALCRLGAGFRFCTGVFRMGEDLVVAGDGDPTLGDPLVAAEAGGDMYSDLDRWSRAVKARCGGQVRHVLLVSLPGRIVRHPGWPAAQKRQWYAAPVASLNFNDNCLDVTFAHSGTALVPVIQPFSRQFRITNQLKAGAKNLWSLNMSDDDAALTLTGTIAKASEDPMNIAVDQPELLFGRALADRLVRAGVAVSGKVRLVAPADVQWQAAELVACTETSLIAAMKRANKRSLNMVAEAIFLRAGDGTWEGSAPMMAETLTREFALAPGSVAPADGGGLGRGNRVTPAAMAKILGGMARRPDAMVLLSSLPVGGVDGTLHKRFTQPPCRGRVIAKTGYIAGVSCLSGYVLDEKLTVRFVFSVLVNGIRGGTGGARTLEETVCQMLIDSISTGGPTPPRPPSRTPDRGGTEEEGRE